MFEPPIKIASLMCDFEANWFIAGGWAIDLFLETQTRPHNDIEIAIFRKDQLAVQNYLENRDLKKAVNGKLMDWKRNECLELPIHEIHCFNEKEESPFLEILLNETKGKDWVFRRDKRITKPLSELYLIAGSGIKFLRPEIVLLYKSKNPREKDEQDFQAVERFLSAESKKWLKNALLIYNSEHHWRQSL